MGCLPAIDSLHTETPWLECRIANFAKALVHPGLLALLSLFALVQIYITCLLLPARSKHWDFSIYYLSGTVARQGLDPYTTDFTPLGHKLGLEVGDIKHATDPPSFVLLFSPLTMLPEQISYYIWQGLNAVLLALSLALLFGKLWRFDRRSGLALAVLALLYPPVYLHFFLSQSKIPILFLLVLMTRAMERGWFRGAGVCLSLTILLRIFPVILIGYLLIQRRWRVLLWTVIGCVVGGLISVALFGLTNSLSFPDGVALCTSRHFLSLPYNLSITAAVSRLCWSINVPWRINSAVLPGSAIALTEFALLGLAIWATNRLRPEYDPYWCGFSLWIVLAVLLSPTAWPHYMVLFLIVFAQIAYGSVSSRTSARTQLAAISSYLLLLVLFTPPYAPIFLTHLTSRWTQSLNEAYFFSAMLLCIASCYFVIDQAGLDAAGQAGAPRTAPVSGSVEEQVGMKQSAVETRI